MEAAASCASQMSIAPPLPLNGLVWLVWVWLHFDPKSPAPNAGRLSNRIGSTVGNACNKEDESAAPNTTAMIRSHSSTEELGRSKGSSTGGVTAFDLARVSARGGEAGGSSDRCSPACVTAPLLPYCRQGSDEPDTVSKNSASDSSDIGRGRAQVTASLPLLSSCRCGS